MKVNHYYSLSIQEYGEDDELLHLCRDCAKQHADQVQWASRGDDQTECEFCRATNDPAHTAHLNAVFAQYAHA